MTPEAYRELVPRLHARVLSYAAWMLGDIEEARDITQESFLRLWAHHGEVHEAAARTWLLRAAHRQCIDRYRRTSPASAPADFAATLDPEAQGPDDVLATQESIDAVTRAIGHLGPEDRALLLLRDHHGLAYAEIALIAGRPLGTIKAAVHRARRRIGESLSPEEITP